MRIRKTVKSERCRDWIVERTTTHARALSQPKHLGARKEARMHSFYTWGSDRGSGPRTHDLHMTEGQLR